MSFVEVTDLHDPRLEPYRDLRNANSTRWRGTFIAEGHRCVRLLLGSRFETISVLASSRRLHLIADEIGPRVPCYVVEEALAAELIGFQFHGGVLACGRRQPPAEWSSILPADPDAPALVVACPKMTDPNNLGGLIRLSAGFGATAVALNTGCCDPFSRRVLRVSMGTACHLPIVDSTDLAAELHRLRQDWNFQIVASVLADMAIELSSSPRPSRLVLLLGNEADGLADEWIALSDWQVVIPMADLADSLNVTVAAGIMLHHFRTPSARPD